MIYRSNTITATAVHNPRMQTFTNDQDSTSALPRLQPLVLSLVVPTRNEAGNIVPLVERLERTLFGIGLEIIFVDDSDDDTPAIIEAVRQQAQCPITLLARPPGQRVDGLGGAVVAGMQIAQAPWIAVMDADLQHPPELLAQMLHLTRDGNIDMVLASRYCAAGDAGGLNQLRAVVSQASTVAARLLFPKRLRNVTDPMSGFFMVRRDVLQIDALHPRGFKILLEILVRTPHLRVAEVAFQFGKRHAGASKASLREGMRYLSHLWSLRISGESSAFLRFLAVGVSGLVVNSLVLALATDALLLYYLLSVVLATQASTLWNFALTEYWVFADRKQAAGRSVRLLTFLTLNNAALSLRGPMIYGLTTLLGVHYLTSNLLSLVALTLIRYAVADSWIWSRTRPKRSLPAMYTYNIHGIVTVVSQVWLPELEPFMVEYPIATPTIRVRIGNIKAGALERRGMRRIRYAEGVGPFGFGIDVTLGETIEIVGSHLLRWSPHVLYTNVVEPILRWTFVEKGYALVHGACLAFGNNAYLVTARTDTGKTTTILRLLSKQRRESDTGAFLSDDLTLVAPDGRVMTYPKPLTISHHTVQAINTALLTRLERLALLVQSRIHSRSGRRFAMVLARTKLPVATVNTVVQLVVPPPKYHVERLVPRAKRVQEARLAGMFIIERGEDGDVPLDQQTALDILMTNCDDAYGFPPYHSIKSSLYDSHGLDLQAVERRIVASALRDHPTVLVRSSVMDWADRLPRLLHIPETQRAEQLPPLGELALSPAV